MVFPLPSPVPDPAAIGAVAVVAFLAEHCSWSLSLVTDVLWHTGVRALHQVPNYHCQQDYLSCGTQTISIQVSFLEMTPLSVQLFLC